MTHKRTKGTSDPSHSSGTNITVVDDLNTTLSELLIGCAHMDSRRIHSAISYLKASPAASETVEGTRQLPASFHEALWGLRTEFDPSTVTMASTNIPDAILKLSAVLTETSESSQKVFTLVDKHQEILKQSERCLGELEHVLNDSQCSQEAISTFIHRQRILNQALQAVSQDIVMSQEFQDLCGQRVKKVVKLLCDVECYLRALFQLLKIELPSTQRSAEQKEQDKDIDQASADNLLKELGL